MDHWWQIFGNFAQIISAISSIIIIVVAKNWQKKEILVEKIKLKSKLVHDLKFNLVLNKNCLTSLKLICINLEKNKNDPNLIIAYSELVKDFIKSSNDLKVSFSEIYPYLEMDEVKSIKEFYTTLFNDIIIPIHKVDFNSKLFKEKYDVFEKEIEIKYKNILDKIDLFKIIKDI